MLTIRDLPAVIERAIPMPPHATIGQGVAVERLRAVTEAQVREVIEAKRDRAHESSEGNLATLEAALRVVRERAQVAEAKLTKVHHLCTERIDGYPDDPYDFVREFALGVLAILDGDNDD